MWIKSTSFNVWVRYFVWNLKGTLWNSTQNILPIHWNTSFLYNCKSSYMFLKRPLAVRQLLFLAHAKTTQLLLSCHFEIMQCHVRHFENNAWTTAKSICITYGLLLLHQMDDCIENLRQMPVKPREQNESFWYNSQFSHPTAHCKFVLRLRGCFLWGPGECLNIKMPS